MLSDSMYHAAEDVPAEAAHGHSKRKALKKFLHKLRHGAEPDTIPGAPSHQGEHSHNCCIPMHTYFGKRVICTKFA